MKSTTIRRVLAFMVSIAMVFGLTPSYAFANSPEGETQPQIGSTQETTTPLTAEPSVGNSLRANGAGNEESIKVYSWSEVQTAVQSDTGGKPIKLMQDCVNSGSDRGRIQIRNSVTIDLNGFKLDRDLSKRYDNGHVIEVMDNATLTIQDGSGIDAGKITGGFSKDGGGIYINDGSTVVLEGGTIAGNKATKEGGGVYVAKGGKLKISGGYIDGNTAASYGGGIVAYGTLTATGGAITSNTAGDAKLSPTSVLNAEGGGIYVCANGTMSLASTRVEGNTAGKNGGGIFVHSKYPGSIKGGSIARNSTIAGNGGGIYMDAEAVTLTIEELSIEGNESADSGGGIYLYWGTIDMMKTVDGGNCSLKGNRAANGGGGAMITRKTTFKASGVAIQNNEAVAKEGGGIKNLGTTKLTNCEIANNHAVLQGGGIYNDNHGEVDASLSLTGCTISQNETESDGGGIYSNAKIYSSSSAHAALSINGGTIEGNFAGTGKGNGLYVAGDSDNPQIQGKVVIDGNSKTISKQEAYLSTNKKFELSDALESESRIGVTLKESTGVFTDRYTERMGQDGTSPNEIFFSPENLDVVRDGNEAKLVCYWDDLQSKIDAAQDNGTVEIDRDYTYSASSSYKALTIPANKHLTIDLHGYTVNRNASAWDEHGSAIVVPSGAELTIKDTGRRNVDPGTGKITGGWGVKGGGILVKEGATLNFKGGTITGNQVTDNGGGIYVDGTLNMESDVVDVDGTRIATSGVIDGNAAGEGRDDFKAPIIGTDYYKFNNVGHGGGIYVNDHGTINLTNATITKNKAKQHGGGIYTMSGTGSTIKDSAILLNEADESGGGIYMDANNKTLEITDTHIDNNVSKDDGGGIYLLHGNITMVGSEAQATQASSISRNNAKNDSGGIKVEEGATFTATNVSLCYNRALSKEGGAIKNYGTTKLTNCTVDHNTAKKRGGGIYNGFYEDSAEGDLTIEGCAITNNTTEEVGGGIVSSRKLTLVGADEDSPNAPATTITGNEATDEGGGIYVGSDAKETSIAGKILVQNNTAERGNDLYLKSGRKLTIAGKIKDTKIGDIAMEKSGTFTKDYGENYRGNPDNPQENHPSTFFGTAEGAIPVAWTDDFKEAQLDTSWPDLQQKITEAENSDTHKVVLDRDYAANSNDTRLKIHEGKTVILDLNGHTINRNLTSVTDNGHVMELFEGAQLTIEDNNPNKTGKIIGGYSKFGGGIYVGKGATLDFNGGTITRNHATQRGGGIYVHGGATVNIGGGTVSGNKSDRNGGGIFVDGSLVTTSGVVDGNKTGISNSLNASELFGCGGGIFVSPEGTMALSGLTVTNNSTVWQGGGIYLSPKGNTSIGNSTIAHNNATAAGGGIFLDAEGKTLTIEDSHIDSNFANIAGGGFYLRWGTITMSGTTQGACTLSNNAAVKEGGGGVVTSNTNCTATNVDICGNTVSKEGGGGILNAGTTKLENSFIGENMAPGQGGGIYNTGEGTLTLQSCSVCENTSESNGGGICSNNKLYLIGGEVLDNSASNRGGGIFIDEDAGTTGIEGDLIVRDNAAARYGNDVFLLDGKKLTLTAGLGGNADIGVDLEKGTGTITKSFRSKNPSTDPQECFIVAAGFDLKVKNGEVVIESGWKTLKNRIESAPDGEVIELDKSYAAVPSDDRIIISEGKHITVDLKGYTLNRNKGGKTADFAALEDLLVDSDGHVFDVSGTLTLQDSSDAKTGVVTGGWAKHGGGVFVHGGATLDLEGGTITGNRASEGGGGIYVNDNGTLNMKGGTIEENATNDNGGGIYVAENGTLHLSGGTIASNTADKRGGGIYAKSSATISAKGNPVVRKNSAAAAGHDIYLPANTRIKVKGAFAKGARMGIAIEGDYGVFTDGYGQWNSTKEPSLYFVSTQAYEVSRKNSGGSSEAALGPDTYGDTDYEKPFIDRNDQIKTDPDVLTGQNWMSGISGERRLNEINMPGSHDSGMYKTQKLTDIALDYTATYSYFAYDSGAFYATTQTKYINQQLEEGARQLDLRLNDWYKAKVWYGYDWDDDGESLWVCHGTSGFGGTYFAVDENGDLLSFAKVLEWVKDFLKKHPTETVILNMRAETPMSGHSDIIYERAQEILQKSALQINSATGEPFLYKEGGSDNYFAPYTQMPQLKDCRGKIVLLPQSGGFVDVVGGVRGGETMFKNTDNQISYTDPTTFTVTGAEQLVRIRKADAELNANGPTLLPSDADEQYDFLWYWELNCTGEDQGYLENYTSGVNPVMHANRVNPGLIGDGKTFGPNKTGEYIGWVRTDAFSAKYAEPIWRTNIFERDQYCTVTVKSDLGAPYEDQTFQVLKGTTIEIPGNIYKDPIGTLLQGKYLNGWQADGESSGTRWICDAGEQFRIDENVTFTANWLNEGKVPVTIVWQDGNNADKIRPSSVQLSTNNGQTFAATVTSNDGWSTVVEGTDRNIIPYDSGTWFNPRSSSDPGQDADGQYRYERNLVGGNGLVFTFIHTPLAKVKAAGAIVWDGDDAAERPDSVTLHLRAKGSDDDIESITVAAGAGDSWQYGFGDDPHEFPQYKDGKKIEYEVIEDAVEGYSTAVKGFSITNTRTRTAPETAEVRGVVEWDDARNAEGSRPESVTVHLYANGVEDTQRGPLTVTEGEYGQWAFNFGEVPVNDSNGTAITYSVAADQVPEYKDANVEQLGPYSFRITNTLDVPEDQKEQAEITSAPKPCSPTYNGEARTLIEAGHSPHGTMMYALDGGNAGTPDITDFSTRLPVATDAGTYVVWYYVKGDALHKDTSPVRMEAKIVKRPATFTGESATAAYTGSEIEISGISAEGLVRGHEHNVAFSAKGTDVGEHEGTFTDSADIAIKSGENDVTANYELIFEPGILTIEQDPQLSLEITSFESATFTYDGKAHALAAATTDALSGETTVEYSKDGEAWTADLASLSATAVADSCTIRARATNPNYKNVAMGDATLSITPASVTITAKNASKEYDGKPLTQQLFDVSGLAETDDHEFAVAMTAGSTITNAGTQPNVIATVDGTAVAAGTEATVGNYLVTTADGILAITQKEFPPSPGGDTHFAVTGADDVVYDGSEHKQPVTVKDGSTELKQNVDYTLEYSGDTVNVTDEGVTITVKGTGNYYGEMAVAYKIIPRPVTFTGKSETKDFTGSTITINTVNVTPTAEGKGLVDGHAHNVVFSASGIDVDDYPGTITSEKDVRITSGDADVTRNYKVTVVNGTLTIQPTTGTLTVSLDGYDYVYDATPHALPATATTNAASGVTTIEYSFEEGGEYVGDLSTLTKTNAGDYTVYVRATNPNYGNTATGTAALSIAPAKLTITAYDQTDYVYTGKMQGEGDTAYEDPAEIAEKLKVEGLKGKDELTHVQLFGQATDAGEYTGEDGIVPSNAAVASDGPDNYAVEYVPGMLKINPAPATVKTGADSKAYDGTPLTKDEAAIEGLVENETCKIEATGTITEIGSTSNTYRITWAAEGNEYTAKASNYTVTEDFGTLTVTVNSAAVTLTAPSDSKTYDGTALTCDGTGDKKVATSGLPEGFTVEATTSGSRTDAGESANTVNDGYVIRDAQGNDKTANFTNVTKVDGKLTINPKAVTVTANASGKEFAEPDPAFTATVAGNLNGDPIVYTVTRPGAGTDEAVGTYKDAIVAAGEAAQGNYAVTFAPADFTIAENGGALTLTAESGGGEYTGSAYGLKNVAPSIAAATVEYKVGGGEWTATAPTATNVADSMDGSVSVRATLAGYAPAQVDGLSIVVTPKPATVTANDASKVAGEDDPAFTGKVEGLISENDLGEVKYVRTGTDEAPGTYEGVITAEYVANPNYEVSVTNGDFTIAEAPAEKGAYAFVSGVGGTYTQGSNKELGFKIERATEPETAFGHFTGIKVDGKAVPEKDASNKANWTAKSGSVVLALQPSYLDGLAKGKHTVSALFDDGDAATTEFTVAVKATPSPTPNSGDNKTVTQNSTTSAASAKGVPAKTGDATDAATSALGILALIALCTAAFALIRRRANRE